MAKRSAPPEGVSATGGPSIDCRIQEQRQHLFNAMSIIEMARDVADEADGNSEEPAGPLTNIWRALTVAGERLDQVNSELDSIATDAREVAHG